MPLWAHDDGYRSVDDRSEYFIIMKLSTALNHYPSIVLTGPIKTRLEFEYGITTPAWQLLQDNKASILRELYRDDCVIAQQTHTPIIIPATTFRASAYHLPSEVSVEQVNQLSVNFVLDLQTELTQPQSPVLTEAPIGPMYDAYSAQRIPTIDEARNYHQRQVNTLQNTAVDFIAGITLPSLKEALGIAQALQDSEKEYVLGFVLNPQGHLLDGHQLATAMDTIDQQVNKPPLGYLIYCSHASAFRQLNADNVRRDRLIGFKANASDLSLAALDNLNFAVADKPEDFAGDLAQLQQQFGLNVLGGCCGTNRGHLEALTKICAKKLTTS